jgi:hypothetical protein
VKRVHLISIVMILIILFATLSLFAFSTLEDIPAQNSTYVGVAFGGTTVEQAKVLIDRTKDYTNLFVLDSGLNPISSNESAVKEICDYAVNAGLHIIVNLGTYTAQDWPWKIEFLNQSKQLYGSKFLGGYYDDEPGGIPLDWNWTQFFTENSTLFSGASPLDLSPIHYKLQLAEISGIQPSDYNLEAAWFNQLLVRNRGHISLNQNNIKTFTSDYVLYWFDYLGGYDTLLAQLGPNQTSTQPEQRSVNEQTTLALLRGAATMQNKDWGAIITWTYDVPPYLDTGQKVYDQMKLAYNMGAKYIMLFDYPYNVTGSDGNVNPYGILTSEHFQALKIFWDKVMTKPPIQSHAEAALVLPNNYGWGLRNPTDRIWGFWGPDDRSPIIWNNTQTLLNQYGPSLDIIYEDPMYPIQGNYSKIYYWNQTI